MQAAGGLVGGREMFANLLNAVKRRDRFTLEELRRLNDVVARTTTVTTANRDALVETFREIAELMIWGDQNEPSFFDAFVEMRTLTHFSRFINQQARHRAAHRQGQPARGGSHLTLQLLQTLSIMVQNIQLETSLFYLFSNNHVNELIECDFDFDDEEVMAYYISLLKTISLKLNPATVQFFFDYGVWASRAETRSARRRRMPNSLRFLYSREPSVSWSTRRVWSGPWRGPSC